MKRYTSVPTLHTNNCRDVHLGSFGKGCHSQAAQLANLVEILAQRFSFKG